MIEQGSDGGASGTRDGVLEVARRYRTLAVILLTVGLIVALPGGPSGLSATGRSGGGGGTTDLASEEGDVAGGFLPDGTPVEAGGSGPGATGSRAAGAGGSTTGGSAGPGGSQATAPKVDTGGFPGVGTPAALANPNCDKTLKLIRIPDYMASQCVAKWPAGADNGGATSPGVTKDSIRIVVTYTRGSTQSDDDINEYKAITRELFYVYQQHNELWGRKIDLKFYERSGTDEIAQRADAVQIANQLKPFMVLDPTIAARPMVVSSAELAARKIIAVDHQPPWKDTQSLAPYRWGIGHDERLFAEHIAEFVAKGLQGRPARWAGDARMQTQPRKFGLIYPDTWDIGFFNAAAKRQNLKVDTFIQYKTGDLTSYQDQVRTQMAKLSGDGINNVIAGAELFYLVFATKEATAQRYLPEWTLTGWGVSDVSLGGRLYDPAQTAHMFGIGAVPTLNVSEDQVTNRVYAWEHGRQPADTATSGSIALLLQPIFRGLQNAGPRLTPQTFKQAMFDAPAAGGFWCQCVTSTGESFGRQIDVPWDDYSAWDDMTLKWWKADEPGRDEVGIDASGMFVMVEKGKRYVPGSYPKAEPPFFVNQNVAHHLSRSELPPQDRWPDYKHDAASHTNYCGKTVEECMKGAT